MAIDWSATARLNGGGHLSQMERNMTLRGAVSEAAGWPARQLVTTTITPERPLRIEEDGPELATLGEAEIRRLAELLKSG